MLEKEIEGPVTRWCKKIKLKNTKLNVMGARSMPDRLYWIPGGKPFLIEYKAPGEEPTKLQADEHKILRELGYDLEVHDNVEKAKQSILKRLESTEMVTPRISKERGKILARAWGRRPISRPRTRKN